MGDEGGGNREEDRQRPIGSERENSPGKNNVVALDVKTVADRLTAHYVYTYPNASVFQWVFGSESVDMLFACVAQEQRQRERERAIAVATTHRREFVP